MHMRVLIFGGSGMLGHKLVQTLSPDFDVWSTVRGKVSEYAHFGIFVPAKTIPDVHVEDPAAIRRAVEKARPDIVINSAGVIKQLSTASDVIQTLTINSIFPHRLAQLSEEFGFRLFCISTDCVFDGARGNYTEDDAPNAYDLYGKSKNLGEVVTGNCVTLRTSIIGRELGSAHSLVEWFLSNRGKTVNGYSNAIYSGFPTIVLAGIIRDLINDHPNLRGLYHVSSEPINKYDLLLLIKQKFGLNITVQRDDEFRIDRSLDSTKFRNETGFSPETWEKMIELMAADPTPYDKWRQVNN